MSLSEELAWRGFVNQTTYTDLSVLDSGTLAFYWGVDPSADSMTIGNLAAAMMVKALMRHGHKAVLLVGGATGMIGDPDGKSSERSLQTLEEIEHNKRAITRQYKQLFGKYDFKIVDNYDWFKDMRYLEFLREVGKHVPLRQMIGREFVQSRLGDEGTGISYAEFSYVLIQAYDFLQLYEKEHVVLQVCGSDQWGNSIAGVDLIRRKTGGEAHVFSAPLIVNKATGRKFGKSEEGAVWLDAVKTTPTRFYQFWVNADDEGVGEYLKVFTELDKPTIEKILKEHAKEPGKRLAQLALASEVTRLVHGDAAAKVAETVTSFLVGAKDVATASPAEISALSVEIPAVKVHDNSSIIETLVKARLADSNTEARRLIRDKAVSLSGNKISREVFQASDFKNGRLLIKRGKAFKDSALVYLG